MRAGAVAVIAAMLAVGACGGGKGKGAAGGKGGGGSIGIGGAGGATDGGLMGCLDQPGSLDRPPSGRLPCDLIPPGLRL